MRTRCFFDPKWGYIVVVDNRGVGQRGHTPCTLLIGARLHDYGGAA